MKCLWLLTASMRKRSDGDKYGNKRRYGEHCFFISRNTALIENDLLRFTSIPLKLHNYTLSWIKILVFTLSNVVSGLSIHCADQNQHSNTDILIKSHSNTLKTYANKAFEYLQAYNISGGVTKFSMLYSESMKMWRIYKVFSNVGTLYLTFWTLNQWFYTESSHSSITRRKNVVANCFMPGISFYSFAFMVHCDGWRLLHVFANISFGLLQSSWYTLHVYFKVFHSTISPQALLMYTLSNTLPKYTPS